MGVDQFSLQVRTAHGVIDVVVLLVGLPEVMHCHAAGVWQHAHIRDALLAALFLNGIIAPLLITGAVQPMQLPGDAPAGLVVVGDRQLSYRLADALNRCLYQPCGFDQHVLYRAAADGDSQALEQFLHAVHAHVPDGQQGYCQPGYSWTVLLGPGDMPGKCALCCLTGQRTRLAAQHLVRDELGLYNGFVLIPRLATPQLAGSGMGTVFALDWPMLYDFVRLPVDLHAVPRLTACRLAALGPQALGRWLVQTLARRRF